MSKTEFTDLFDLSLGKNFIVASRLIDIRNRAERIADQANEKQIANGEFAVMFAENIKDWMNDIASVANNALDSHIEENAEEK